ncbi:hypothetical protein [Rhodothermus bifroesti]|uniref:hypothetical protein n=1 Tax=Rhodothermus bifroesti TaxID=2823335 RepID=UPI001AEFC0F6|nr:hypothetical protein [Rhodothermus bifroesti]
MRIAHVLLGRCNPDSANGVDKTVYPLARHQALLEVWDEIKAYIQAQTGRSPKALTHHDQGRARERNLMADPEPRVGSVVAPCRWITGFRNMFPTGSSQPERPQENAVVKSLFKARGEPDFLGVRGDYRRLSGVIAVWIF